jgi:CRP/FNR family transcriptional regulator, anaerobic regulatory protein
MMKKLSTLTLCTDPKWLGRSDCKLCGIRRMMLFSGLKDEDFDQILEPIDNFRYPKRTLFYNEGDLGNKVYSIRRGFVKLVQTRFDGSQRILRLLGPGAIIGLEALLENAYRHTAIALQEVEVCRIYTVTLKRLEADKPWLNEKVMAHWEQHLMAADRWISDLSTGAVRSRVLNLIHYLLEINGGNSNTVRFFGSEDMAAMVGTSRETFSRIISELKDEGVISKVGEGPVYRLNAVQ